MKIICSVLAAAVLAVTPAGATVFTYAGDGGTIRDFTNTRSTIAVTDIFTVADANVIVDGLTHSFPRDVQLFLERGVQSIRLIDNNGPGRDGSFGTGGLGFDDEAATSIRDYSSGMFGPYRPIDALSLFDGQSAAGDWTLRAYDSAGGDTGSFGGWRLQLDDGVAAPPPTSAAPEPATWAVMMLGFGLAGAAMRRRRRAAVLA